MTVNADRWVEVDLYWFDPADVAGRAAAFLDRVGPLFDGVDGWRGVVVNAGWLVDHVLDWRGSPAGRIPFPAGIRRDAVFTDAGPLRGTLAERMAGWRARFASEVDLPGDHDYPEWTYAGLRDLATALRAAARARGIADLKVGTFVLGWESIYGSALSGWAERQPDGFATGPWPSRLFNVVARLRADTTSYGAFPDGVAEGTPVTAFFGRQWGSLSRAVGLDAIVLRDSMIGPGIYDRVGLYGETAPADPALVAAWSAATGDLVRETKLANPEALVIGYSNAASAVADWRVNCVDLEAIAREGFLDAWIDQTWAGAWNEVGQRRSGFWNRPSTGWTYQLAYVLLHAAALADTTVRHYTLTETFDAWESWDVIHTAPGRLRWGIWAYQHAFVKTPDGLRPPAGSYVSWANQGGRLLSESDVDFLATELDAAAADARATVDVAGATLVYCRPAMAWQSAHAPDVTIKEWIDEQAGTLLKWSVPIASVTRSEWLGAVGSDLFVVQTPVHLPAAERDEVLGLIERGPVAIVGSPAGGLDPAVAAALGVSTSDPRIGPVRFEATAEEPARFAIHHPWTRNVVIGPGRVWYEVDGSPCLVVTDRVVFWDPPDFRHTVVDGRVSELPCPIADQLGSPHAFVLAARALHTLLATTGALTPVSVDAAYPVCVLGWKLADGTTRLLVGDLEEGFRDSTDGVARLSLRVDERTVAIELGYAETRLLTLG